MGLASKIMLLVNGSPVSAGVIGLKNGKIQILETVPGFDNVLLNVISTPVLDYYSQPINIQSNPEEWIERLPLQYHGSYMWATVPYELQAGGPGSGEYVHKKKGLNPGAQKAKDAARLAKRLAKQASREAIYQKLKNVGYKRSGITVNPETGKRRGNSVWYKNYGETPHKQGLDHELLRKPSHQDKSAVMHNKELVQHRIIVKKDGSWEHTVSKFGGHNEKFNVAERHSGKGVQELNQHLIGTPITETWRAPWMKSSISAAAKKDNRLWIGFDFDSTLAKYKGDVQKLGKPIQSIVDKAKEYLAKGITVKIFTARTDDAPKWMKKALQRWCEKNLGQKLAITNKKDKYCLAIYDDKAVQVEPNTGKILGKEPKISAGGPGSGRKPTGRKIIVHHGLRDADDLPKILKEGLKPQKKHGPEIWFMGEHVKDAARDYANQGRVNPDKVVLTLRVPYSLLKPSKDTNAWGSMEYKTRRVISPEYITEVSHYKLGKPFKYAGEKYRAHEFTPYKVDKIKKSLKATGTTEGALKGWDTGKTLKAAAVKPKPKQQAVQLLVKGTPVESPEEKEKKEKEHKEKIEKSLTPEQKKIRHLSKKLQKVLHKKAIKHLEKTIDHHKMQGGGPPGKGPGSGNYPHKHHGTAPKDYVKQSIKRGVTTKQALAIKNARPIGLSDAKLSDYAEEQVMKALGGERTRDHAPVDVVVKRGGKTYGVEVKALTRQEDTPYKIAVNRGERIYMKKEAMARKEKWARQNNASLHSVAVDMRGKKVGQKPNAVYHREGIGSFSVWQMSKTSLKGLKGLVK